MFKKINLIFLCCVLLICNVSYCFIKKPSLNILSKEVPSEAIEYAYEIAPVLLGNALLDLDMFSIETNNHEDRYLGQPFTIFNIVNGELLDNDIYYFPVMKDKEIKTIISVFKVDGEWSASTSSGMVDELNDLYGDYLLFEEDCTVYVQNKNETIILLQDHTYDSISDEVNESYANKVKELKDKDYSIVKQNITQKSHISF